MSAGAVLGVDATRLAGARVGVARYYEALVRGWAGQEVPFDRITLYTRAPLEGLEGVEQGDGRLCVEVLGGRGPGLWWQLSRLRRRAAEIEVLLAPYTLPPAYPGKAVVSNHGILEGSDRVSGALARLRTHHFRYSALRAEAVIANTSATKADLVSFYGVPEERITVVLPGIDNRFRPARGADEGQPGASAAEELLGSPGPYFLFVGKLSRRRHVPELLEAFALATARRPEFRLLLAGPTARGGHELELPVARHAADLGIADRVRHVEFLGADTIAGLYRGARALLMPTEKESFSRPIAEAMASGCPVLTLRSARLGVAEYVQGPREHAAGGPLLEAEDAGAEAMSAAIAQLVSDDGLCAELRDRGLRCAAGFATPAEQARQAIAVAARVAGASP